MVIAFVSTCIARLQLWTTRMLRKSSKNILASSIKASARHFKAGTYLKKSCHSAVEKMIAKEITKGKNRF